MPFASEDRWELGSLHEEVLLSLDLGEYDRVIDLGEQLARRAPQFLPVKNNLSYVYFQSGHISQAIEYARAVLSHDPVNVHALAT